jgi:hypothetical protein
MASTAATIASSRSDKPTNPFTLPWGSEENSFHIHQPKTKNGNDKMKTNTTMPLNYFIT